MAAADLSSAGQPRCPMHTAPNGQVSWVCVAEAGPQVWSEIRSPGILPARISGLQAHRAALEAGAAPLQPSPLSRPSQGSKLTQGHCAGELKGEAAGGPHRTQGLEPLSATPLETGHGRLGDASGD